jgi:cysteine desulfurase
MVALVKAAECPNVALAEENGRVRRMRDRFEAGILERVPETFINGDSAARLPNTSNLSFSGIEADAALVMFDRQQLCCSAGSACRTGSLESSHVLRAMNVPAQRARASMRFSFGRFNTEADIDKALEIIPDVISKLRALSAGNAVRQPATV